MPNSSGLAVKVGIFVVVGLVILIGFSLRVNEGRLGKETYRISAYFDEAIGLEEGANVSLLGVLVGRVETMKFDPKRRQVRAVLEINGSYQIAADSVARTERSPFLGNSYIVIRYGEAAAVIPPGGEIDTEPSPDIGKMVAAVSDASEEARKLMSSLNENQNEVMTKLEDIIVENRDDIKRTSESFASVGPKLETLADQLMEFTSGVQDGQGTLGRLYTDETLYDDLKSAAAEARQVMSDIQSSEGSLHALIYEDDLVRKAEASFDQLGGAGEEIQTLLVENREDLDELVKALSELGPRIDSAMSNFQEINEKLNGTDGTLGLLINDPSLYQDAKKTVNQIGESFESSEEQGVIRSVFGILFGAIL